MTAAKDSERGGVSASPRPLAGVRVLELAQYLAGPLAGLKLSDLGATVLKVESPGAGDAGRALATRGAWLDDDSVNFHTVNRGKKSITLDLKSEAGMETILSLVAEADVLITNFRPGVMERLGLGYDELARLNSRLIYASASGYGTQGPWVGEPGQDLLVQARTGLASLNGTHSRPVPVGLATADTACAEALTHGILSLLIRRARTGAGGLVETSLVEAAVDLQFDLLVHALNRDIDPKRRAANEVHPLLPAPYGVYETSDGAVAIAMGSHHDVLVSVGADFDKDMAAIGSEFAREDDIREAIAARALGMRTDELVARLVGEGIWAARVNSQQEFAASAPFADADMIQTVRTDSGTSFRTTRYPVRFDGEQLRATAAAPSLGRDNPTAEEEFTW